ncbi:hypothetical protein ACROYT_G033457 [Oculina patagonica]
MDAHDQKTQQQENANCDGKESEKYQERTDENVAKNSDKKSKKGADRTGKEIAKNSEKENDKEDGKEGKDVGKNNRKGNGDKTNSVLVKHFPGIYGMYYYGADESQRPEDLERIASHKGFLISENHGLGNCMLYALVEQLQIM